MNVLPWTLKMAWRDSRGSRRRLFLYLSSMVLGVAALVAISGFGDSLTRAIDREAQSLLGADLALERRQPFRGDIEALIDSIGGEQARRVSFGSMAYFPQTGGTRLATIRAVEGAYPFYGDLETRPAQAAETYREGPRALVDATLMQQMGVEAGDTVRVGDRGYEIAGALVKSPSESMAFSLISPRIYLPRGHLDEELLGTGSRAEYDLFFRFDDGRDVEALLEDVEPQLREQGVRSTTVAEAVENWEIGLTHLYRFLSLVGFVALLLGGLGVASAVHVYVKRRVETVAVLRCLGAKAGHAFRIYLAQAAAMGLASAVLGCALGLALQGLVPRVLADFLPVTVEFVLSPRALLLGLVIGLGATLLFALLPLLPVRNVSPMLALRASVEAPRRRDPLRVLVMAGVGAGIAAFAVAQAPAWWFGLGYAAGIAAVFGLLALVARGIMVLARRGLPAAWSYPWRQGLANLYRPNNQTLVLVLVLGLGTFLVLALVLIERTLLDQLRAAGGAGQPNLVLFDVQPDQLEGVTEIVQDEGLPVMARVPIVTMRLSAIGGQSLEALRADTTAELTWAHTHEYRATYRDHLSSSEEIIAGTFAREVPNDEDAPVPISLEEGIAEELGVALDDTLTFNVQGVPMVTTVTSLRAVDWQRVQTNFFVVFPPGPLEEAPQTYVVLSRAGTDAASARLQRAVVEQFPSVLAIDLSLILSVVNALSGRVMFVLRFMTLFSVLTGVVVLAGAVVVSRHQRAEESVLLKTLGAARRQVFSITCIEYFFLGLFAALTGLVLAVGGSWALARLVFDVPFVWAAGPLLLALVAVPGLTVLVGLLSSRGLYARPPLDVLRAEG